MQTRSRLASFCEHFSFVSSIEANKINKALKDADWVNAMHDELSSSKACLRAFSSLCKLLHSLLLISKCSLASCSVTPWLRA